MKMTNVRKVYRLNDATLSEKIQQISKAQEQV